MSPDLKKEIWQEMRSLGDRLMEVLKPDPRHPCGRNPYAHVAGCVRDRFGCSYGDLPDEKRMKCEFICGRWSRQKKAIAGRSPEEETF